MIKQSGQLLKFISFVIGFYLLGLVIYESFLLPKTNLDEYIIHVLVICSESLIHLMGYKTILHQSAFFYTIQIQDSIGVWISPNCDGWMVMWVFLSVWIFLPINNRIKSLALIPFLVLIELVNIFRIVSLTLITKYYPQSLAFNHDYTFTILVYGFVIFLWWWGIKKWSNK